MSDVAYAPDSTSAGTDSIASKDIAGVTSKIADAKRSEISATDKIYSGLDKTLSTALPKIEQLSKNAGVEAEKLKPWNEEAESAKRHTDPIAAFGSLGSVIGILASAFTHAPMENAFNASAAAMNAIRAGDDKEYNRAVKAWEDNTKQTLDRQRIEHETYQDAVALLNTNMAAAQMKLKIAAARFGDQKVLTMLEAGMDKDVIDVINARQNAALKLAEEMPKIKMANAQMSSMMAERTDPETGQKVKYNPKDPTSESSQRAFLLFRQEEAKLKQLEHGGSLSLGKQDAEEVARKTAQNEAAGMSHDDAFAKARSEVHEASQRVEPTLSDETTKLMADQYLAGDKSVLQNIGRGRQGAANIVKVRESIAKEMKAKGITGADAAVRMAEFSGAMAAQRTLGSRTANVEMFANEALNMIDVAQEQSHKIKRTDFVPTNKALQAWERNTGEPEIRAFGAAINSLVNTYAKAIAGGQQATVSDKEHAREIVTAADTQEQFDAVMGVIKKELQAARRAPGQVKQELRDLAGSSPTIDKGNVPSAPGGIIEYDKQGNRVK